MSLWERGSLLQAGPLGAHALFIIQTAGQQQRDSGTFSFFGYFLAVLRCARYLPTQEAPFHLPGTAGFRLQLPDLFCALLEKKYHSEFGQCSCCRFILVIELPVCYL